jgi:hypothetical protein
MTDAELIARQAKQIAEQEDLIADYEERMRLARGYIYCIGGPLNDNVLRYSGEQKVTFQRIADALGEPSVGAGEE